MFLGNLPVVHSGRHRESAKFRDRMALRRSGAQHPEAAGHRPTGEGVTHSPRAADMLIFEELRKWQARRRLLA